MKKHMLMLIMTACYLNAVSIDDYLGWSVQVEKPEYRDTSYYFILAAGDTTASELVTQIHEGLGHKGGSRAFVALANLLGGDRSLLPFSEVTEIVHAIEKQASIDSSKLRLSYQIVAFYNTRASFEFLKRRTEKDFWEQSGMPTFSLEAPDAPGRAEKIRTAQTMAISAVAQHPSQEAETYLKALLRDPEYSQNELLSSWINNALQSRAAYHLTAYKQRQEAQLIKDARNPSNSSKQIEEPLTKVSSTPKIVKAVEDVTPPEPTTEMPAEVKTPNSSEESIEQSSNWWLWLIGLLVVVVGGLAVVVRRKS